MTRLGVGLVAGAGVIVWLATSVNVGTPGADLEVRDAIAAETPSTIPVDVPTQPNDPDAGRTDPMTEPVPALPLSPLAASLPEPVSAVPTTDIGVPPVGITIPDLGLVAPIRSIGVRLDGQLEIPDETEVGWYRLGSSPGRAGATVLAAHVSWNGTTGPFFRLGELEPGERVLVDLADGGNREYEVVERARYSKLALPAERVWTRTGDETLVLITCGGQFDRSIRRYQDNIVVYAVPVAATPHSE